ncbi:MAG: hypothetical protein KKA84_13995 [Bacteroidetes bacterium]|nr:hypothetical protein [Bacteroidota bacterium]
MPRETHIEIKGSCLCVKVFGKYSLERSKKLFTSIFDWIENENLSKVLIDIREMAGKISVVDRFNLANMLQEYRSRFIKIAFLVREDHQKPTKIFETVANNRGIYVITATDEEDIKEWIDSVTLNSVKKKAVH